MLRWKIWYKRGIFAIGDFLEQLFWYENSMKEYYAERRRDRKLIKKEYEKLDNIYFENIKKWAEDSKKLPKYLKSIKKQIGGGIYSGAKLNKQIKDLENIDFEEGIPEDEGEIDYYNFFSELTGGTSDWSDYFSESNIREQNLKRLDARWNLSTDMSTRGSWDISSSEEVELLPTKLKSIFKLANVGISTDIEDIFPSERLNSDEVHPNLWWKNPLMESELVKARSLDFIAHRRYKIIQGGRIVEDKKYETTKYLPKLKRLKLKKNNKKNSTKPKYDSEDRELSTDTTTSDKSWGILDNPYGASNISGDVSSTYPTSFNMSSRDRLNYLIPETGDDFNSLLKFSWHQNKTEIPITGSDIMYTNNDRLLENDWLDSRWNLGYSTKNQNYDMGMNSEEPDVDNIWDMVENIDFDTVHPMFLNAVIQELDDSSISTYSSKIEINYNSEDILQDNTNLKSILNIIPLFKDGNWSESDSGQTSWGQNHLLSDSEIVKYNKTYNPVFGLFIVNPERNKKDLSNMGEVYLELISIEKLIRKISIFLTDEDTQFYDDKIISIHNFWLFWLEFIRHVFITRWRLTWDYTKQNNINKSENDFQFPSPIIHEFYWFKYLVYSRFIKKLTTNLLFSKNYTVEKKATMFENFIPKYKIFDQIFLIYYGENKLTGLITNYKVKKKINRFKNINIVLYGDIKKNLSKYGAIQESKDITYNKFGNYSNPFEAKKTETINFTKTQSKNTGTLPDYTTAVSINDIFSVLSYTRSMYHYRQKNTSGLFTFLKPYRNIELITPYEASNFKYDPGAAIRTHLYFTYLPDNNNEFRKPEFSSDASEMHSNESINFEHKVDKMTDSMEESYTEYQVIEFDGDFEPKLPGDRDRGTINKFQSTTALLTNGTTKFASKFDYKNEILLDNESDYFENNKTENYLLLGNDKKLKSSLGSKKNEFQLKNEFRRFRRKDSNLKYTRNLFLSNHITDDLTHLNTYTGNWINFSDFEPDRQRSRKRNLKHGSKYRLNFNTELWWTRNEIPDYHIRRIDGIEFDDNFGAFDSDGEIAHLHSGLQEVVFTPDNEDIFDTSLPLFEKSLIDPESPALNEDGEFPEFDLNLIYSTYDVNKVKLYKKKQNYKNVNEIRYRIKNYFNSIKESTLNNKTIKFKYRYFGNNNSENLKNIENEYKKYVSFNEVKNLNTVKVTKNNNEKNDELFEKDITIDKKKKMRFYI